MKQSKSTFLKTIVLSISILAFSSVSAYARQASPANVPLSLVNVADHHDIFLINEQTGATVKLPGSDSEIKLGVDWVTTDFHGGLTIANCNVQSGDAGSCSINGVPGLLQVDGNVSVNSPSASGSLLASSIIDYPLGDLAREVCIKNYMEAGINYRQKANRICEARHNQFFL